MYLFRLKLTEYYWYDLKQCIPRVFDDWAENPPYGLSSFVQIDVLHLCHTDHNFSI